jgi:hypothetical protein
MARQGMMRNLQTSSGIQGQQIAQSAATSRLIGQQAMTVARNPSDDNVNAAFDNLIASGMPRDQVERERARWLAMSSDERQDNAVRVGLSSLDQLHQVIGQTTLQNFGGYTAPYTVTQPGARTPGGGYQGPGSVTTTAGPDITTRIVTFPADQAYVRSHPGTTLGQTIQRPYGQVMTEMGASWALPPGATFSGGGGGGGSGVVGNDGKPVGPNNPPRLLNTPGGNQGSGGGTGGPPQGGAAPAPPGASTSGSSAPYTGGGIGTVLNPPSSSAPATPTPPVPPAGARPTAPSVGPPPPVVSTSPTLRGSGTPVTPPPQAPGPSVNSPTDSMTPQPPRSALTPPTQFAGPGAPTNALAASASPVAASPAATADANTIMAAIAARRAAGRSQGTQMATDVPIGPGTQEIEENKRSADLLTQHDTAAATYPQSIFPYTQALSLYGRGMTTAPGSDLLNTAKGWANGAARSVGITGPFDSTQEYDALHKYLTQIVSGNPVAAGSDARLAAVLAGNANTSIHELAGADMIKAGIALQRMTVALDNGWHALSPQEQAQYGGSYMTYLRDQAPKIDVRAFARDLYNPEQIKTLNADLQNGSRQDRQNFLDSLALARKAGMIGSGRAMP